MPIFYAYTLSMRQYVPAQNQATRSMGDFVVSEGKLAITGGNPQR